MTPRQKTLQQRKIKAYRWLYEFTFGQCGDCTSTGCACKDSICSHVESQALKKGVQLSRCQHPLRFIGQKGCVVEPHMRETCTIYLCEKAQAKPDFDRERYARLKALCAAIDWELMCIEDHQPKGSV